MPTTQTVQLAVSRTAGSAKLEFTIPEVVRNLWRARNLPVKESQAWSGLSFYVLAPEARTDSYTRMLSEYQLRDDFGAKILDEHGRFNVAFLRCTTASGSIAIDENELSFSQLADNMRRLARFIRAYVEQNVADYRITGSVSIEV